MADSLLSVDPQTPTATPTAPLAPATPEPSVAAPTTPTAPAAGAISQPSNDAMVPSYRLRETREAAWREAQEAFATREADYQARLKMVQGQLHALAGVTPQEETEVDQVRSQFGRVYPGLSKLEERAEQVLQILERAGDMETQNDHYWQSYGRQAMGRLFDKATESYGQPLSEDARRILHSAFLGYVASSPEILHQYTNDPKFVDDFWKNYSTNFIDPVRRVATAGAMARTTGPLPTDAPSGVPRATPPPQLKGLDERSVAAWAQFQKHRSGT